MNPQERLTTLRAEHAVAYNSVFEEVHGLNPVCASDDHAWPCPVAEVFAALEAEVAHRIDPVIGWLRLVERDVADPTPQHHASVTASVERLTETVQAFSGPSSEVSS